MPALQPDLVLLDVYLPDMTGLQVLQRLRASTGSEAEVDVLVVSAANDVESVKQAMRGGAVSYLIKPFAYADLRERLEQLAEVRRRSRAVVRSRRRRGSSPTSTGSSRPPAPVAVPPPRCRCPGSAPAATSSTSPGRGPADVSARYAGAGRPERRFRAP